MVMYLLLLGTARHPQGCSCRTMFIIGYLVTYLMYTGLSAGITSLLAIAQKRHQLKLCDVEQMKLPFSVVWDGPQDNFKVIYHVIQFTY